MLALGAAGSSTRNPPAGESYVRQSGRPARYTPPQHSVPSAPRVRSEASSQARRRQADHLSPCPEGERSARRGEPGEGGVLAPPTPPHPHPLPLRRGRGGKTRPWPRTPTERGRITP